MSRTPMIFLLELWPHILDQADLLEPPKVARETIQSICVTCQDLQYLAQPRLFRRLSFRGSIRDRDRVHSINDLFQRVPESRRWPKEMHLSMPVREGDRPAFANLAMQLGDLKKAFIAYTDIPLPLWIHLISLPSLLTLSFIDSDLATLPFPEPQPNPKSGGALSNLHTLTIAGQYVNTLSPLQHSQEPFLQMTSLKLDSPSTPEAGKCLIKFLLRCPRLQILEFARDQPAVLVRDSFTLPASVIPDLQSFSGLLWLVKHFVPGRPVSRLSIRCGAYSPDIISMLDIIHLPSTPLEELSMTSVPWGDELLCQIAESSPLLRRLEIMIVCLATSPTHLVSQCFNWNRFLLKLQSNAGMAPNSSL